MRRREFLTLAAASAAASALSRGGGAMAQEIGPIPERIVLEGVPYVGEDWATFLNCPQDLTFPSCLRSIMEFLREPRELNYLFFLSVSGLAYRQLWHPQEWQCAFDNVFVISDDPLDGVRRCMAAAGYDFAIIGNAALREASGLPEQAFTQLGGPDLLLTTAAQSLQAGKPCMAFGLPLGACCVIAGLEDAGATALCHGMSDREHPLERDANGYQRLPGWLDRCQGIIALGDRGKRQPLVDVCREAILWAVEGARRERVGEYACGQAAFAAWLAALARDEDLPQDDPGAVRARLDAHQLITLAIAEGRAFAGELLGLAADREPAAADDLYTAEFSYHIMHDLVWRLWQTSDGTGGWDPKPERFALPEVREHLREIVVHIAREDAAAVERLASALVIMGVDPAAIPAPVGMEPRRHGAGPGVQPALLAHEEVNLWVPGVPRIAWGQDRDCCFVGALEAALTPTDYPVAYEWLMGVSGLAFRTRWFYNPTRTGTVWGTGLFHPVSPHGEQPEVIAAINEATGWRLRRETVPEDTHAVPRDRLITDIVMSLNEGLPVVTGRNTDLCCVYGYHIHSMNLFIRDYQRADEEEARLHAYDASFHSPFIFLEGHDGVPAEEDAVRVGLAHAVADGDRVDADSFHYGLAALDAWCETIEAFDDLAFDEQFDLYMANGWTLMHLADARRAAVVFLSEAQGVPEGVAEAYQEEERLLSSFAIEKRAVIPWWTGKIAEDAWGPEARAAQVALLKQARELEEKALTRLGALV